jgi:hypothetical protein
MPKVEECRANSKQVEEKKLEEASERSVQGSRKLEE